MRCFSRLRPFVADLLLAGGLVTLAACGDRAPAAPSQADQVRAERLRPAEPELAAKYERACMTCHVQLAAGAPLTGFAPAWQPLLAKGMDALVTSTVQGLNSMPPGGLCPDCTGEEMRALIAFMAGQEQDKP